MNDERCQFPSIPARLPSRLTSAQAAIVLGVQPHDIPILVAARLLKPLGNPRPQAVRYFFTTEILEHAANRQWAAKATNVLYEHWSRKNRSNAFVEAPDEPLHGLARINGNPN